MVARKVCGCRFAAKTDYYLCFLGALPRTPRALRALLVERFVVTLLRNRSTSPHFSPRFRSELGTRAELLAAAYLKSVGLEILDANVRVGRLEVDLVARDGPVVVIVEVRTRGPRSWQRALDSVDEAKRQRVRKAGEQLWATRFQQHQDIERMRFDIVAVDLTPADHPAIEHIKAAF